MRALHATKTRLALLAAVDAGRVFLDRIGDSYISGGRKVTAAIRELAVVGWATLPDDQGDLPNWLLTDKGRAILNPPAYRVTFDRIGRNHNVPPLMTGPVDGPSHLAALVYLYARGCLASRDVEVVTDLEAGKGHIVCGWHNGGTFTVEQVAGGEPR